MSPATRAYLNLSLRAESLVGIGLWALTVGGVMYCYGIHSTLSVLQDPAAFFGRMAAVSATLLGFTLTNLNLIVGQSQSDRFAFIRESRNLERILVCFTNAVKWLALTLAASIAGSCMPWSQGCAAVAGFAFLLPVFISALRLTRCIVLTQSIIELVSQREPNKA